MFGNTVIPRTFSFTRILGGLSKTLNVANQIIPLYNQAKPLINNARNILGVLKEVNNTPISKNTNIIDADYKIKKEDTSSNFNNPTFFI
jgi:hypothetical protein